MKKKIALLIIFILSCFLFSSCKKEEEYITFGAARPSNSMEIICKTLKYHPIDEEGTVIDFLISIPSSFKDIFNKGGYLELSIQARGESEEGKFSKKYNYFHSENSPFESQKIILKRQDIYISYIDVDIDICKDKYSTKEKFRDWALNYKIDTYKKERCYVFDVLKS